WLFPALLRQIGSRSQNISGVEIEQRVSFERCRIAYRLARAIAPSIHMMQNPADEGRGQIRTQGPRGIRVPHAERKVRNVTQHHSLVNEHLPDIDVYSIDGDTDAAQSQHLQTSS